jgi:hypothetical protein
MPRIQNISANAQKQNISAMPRIQNISANTRMQMPRIQIPGCKYQDVNTRIQNISANTRIQIPCHSANTLPLCKYPATLQIPPEKVTRQSHKTKPMDKTIRQNDKNNKKKYQI